MNTLLSETLKVLSYDISDEKIPHPTSQSNQKIIWLSFSFSSFNSLKPSSTKKQLASQNIAF